MHGIKLRRKRIILRCDVAVAFNKLCINIIYKPGKAVGAKPPATSWIITKLGCARDCTATDYRGSRAQPRVALRREEIA